MSIALIDHGTLAWARAFGDASVRTLYQAASMSKVVAAVAALRLVQQGSLGLDRDVNEALISWRLPASDLTNGHKVNLRGLLSMTGGVGYPATSATTLERFFRTSCKSSTVCLPRTRRRCGWSASLARLTLIPAAATRSFRL